MVLFLYEPIYTYINFIHSTLSKEAEQHTKKIYQEHEKTENAHMALLKTKQKMYLISFSFGRFFCHSFIKFNTISSYNCEFLS